MPQRTLFTRDLARLILPKNLPATSEVNDFLLQISTDQKKIYRNFPARDDTKQIRNEKVFIFCTMLAAIFQLAMTKRHVLKAKKIFAKKIFSSGVHTIEFVLVCPPVL